MLLHRQPSPPRVQPRVLAATVALLFFAVCSVLYRAQPASAARRLAPHARTAFEAHVARAVLRVLDNERRQHGLAALQMTAGLCHSARAHDVAMARADQMSHRLPGEQPFTARIAHAGYQWQSAGENIGWNARISAAGAVQLETLMFHEKPPNDSHRRNILDASFRDVGVDVYVDAVHHKLWLTTDFGSR